jgi:hypothetical protein
MATTSLTLPALRVEPAALLWASTERSISSAEGLLSAVVQQRLTSPERLQEWLDRLPRLPRAPRFRAHLADLSGGAQSLAEVRVGRLCRTHGLAQPSRQNRRIDADGTSRFTDCEWIRDDGRRIHLEVDGSFHMDAQAWEDDIRRQRALSAPDVIPIRCTARELRDDPGRVARDLERVGVPRVKPDVPKSGRWTSRNAMGA